MSAEVDLCAGSEPAQIVIIALGTEKSRFGESHLRSNGLHPGIIAGLFQQTDAGWIAFERFNGERVNVKDRCLHANLQLLCLILPVLFALAR